MTFSEGETEVWPIFASVFAVMLVVAVVVCYCSCKNTKRKTSNGRWFFQNFQNSSHSSNSSPVYIVPGAGAGVDLEGVMPTLPPSYDDVTKNCDLNNYVINDPPPPYNSLEVHGASW